jgi:putative endonuclease
MTKKSELGEYGEKLACKYLKKKGYRIIERNFWKPWGEIDIIAVAPDNTLVFVEVKTMRYFPGGLKPEDHMTSAKSRKVKRTASLYANNHDNLIDDNRGWRIDLIAVDVIRQTSSTYSFFSRLLRFFVHTGNTDDFKIRHYENV